ncbi:asparagine synthase (glutamine-hydrolyzing) [Streptomyces sp. ADMS]|uniref:asparagine synthase (glutamine-hydrolyzing) n=1 Tax=Streptomyces sp. ADMS TaxID=3071415 RepID=UPI00296F44E2|nr:asparagine synthase (glutamine-hydrolyzing) [Streptomyces sp. ADMS]MDW4905913.1 asparagine synthase (glutamine-hydrolyzing) [Streptomyces sp. ADMS]
MSGIAGWVDHRRDLTRERATVRAMTATMACRGPDGEGLWASEHAVLGHRRQVLMDADALPEPFAFVADGETVAVAAVDGEIYNTAELRRELASYGHPFRDGGQAEVVLAAHLRWGTDCVSRFVGVFALAVWDHRAEELLLARDRLGNKPMFYRPTEHGVVFGSERKAILAHPLVEPVVDMDGLREILSYAGTPGHGVFRGIHQIRPGHFVRVTRDGVREHRYWALEAREHTDSLDTTVRTVRELLERAVAEQLDADVPLCMMLSGGLDSSGITALAARTLGERGAPPLRTFTASFRQEGEFQADEVWSTPDAPFARELVERVGADHTDVVLGTEDLLDPVVKANALRAKDVPSPLGNMNTSLYVLFRAIREHADVAVLGDAADGIFGGTMWMSMPPLLQARTFPWTAMANWSGGKHGMGTDLLDAGLLAKLDVPGYCADRYQDAMTRVPHVAGQSDEERRMREIWYLNVTNWLETLLPHSESVAQSLGLALRLPYCDHRLVEYVFNAPWSMKGFDGREKSLLRAALADVLPESILQRRKSPYPVTQDVAYARALCDELLRLSSDPQAPAAALIDTAAARAFAEDPEALVTGPRAWVARTHVEMLFQLNAWLDQYRVRLEL